MDLTFAEVLKAAAVSNWFVGDEKLLEQSVRQVSIDSRTIQPNSLYVAIRGERLDGHLFVADAIKNGAIAAVIDPAGWRDIQPHNPDANFFIVSDTLLALQSLAAYYRQKFSIPFIGLTGTSGKTTTKEMMSAVLSARFHVLKTQGNLNNHLGVPLTLFQLRPEHQLAIIEMGTNHFGEIKRLAEITRPNYGLITNIGHGHLEFLGSLEGVARAKWELFDALRFDDVAFINADDPQLMKKKPPTKRTVYYGLKNKAQIKAEFMGISHSGETRFKLLNEEIGLQAPGIHNIYNALAATSVGLEFGMNIGEIKPLLEAFKPHSKRMEIVKTDDWQIINDCYNANPESTMAALNVLQNMQTAGRKIVVLADMLELGAAAEQEHRNIGKEISKMNVDYLFGFGTYARLLVEEALENLNITARYFENKPDLIQDLKSVLKPGDLILIKGSRGMAMETVLQALTGV